MKIFLENFCLAMAGIMLLVYFFCEYLPKSILFGTLLFALVIVLLMWATVILDGICQAILTIINFFKKK